MPRSAILLVLATLLSSIPLAHADARPAFAMMDNTGDGSEIDVALPVGFYRGSLQAIRPRWFLQGVNTNGFGTYTSLQGSAMFGSGADDDHEAGIGNYELGGVFHAALSPHVDLAVRAGAAFGTQTGGNAQTWNMVVTDVIRPADIATGLPGTWLRFAVSPTFHAGAVFARVDLGADVVLGGGYPPSPNAFLHGDIGAGVALGGLTATVELSTAEAADGPIFDSNNYYTLGASLRYTLGRFAPYLAYSAPLGSYRGELRTFTAGLTTLL